MKGKKIPANHLLATVLGGFAVNIFELLVLMERYFAEVFFLGGGRACSV